MVDNIVRIGKIPMAERTAQEKALFTTEGSSKRFKIFRGAVLGIIGVATGGAAYSALAGSAALSGGAAAGGAGASGSGIAGATGAVGKTAVLAGSGLGGGVAVVSPTVAAAATASTTATAVASGAKAWTLAGAVKQYGGTAMMLLSGASKPATSEEANGTIPFNDANLFADYAYGYGAGGGMGGGPMLTSGGESTGVFDDIVSSPWLLVITGAILLVVGYFFIRK